jgi:hypothetical protein
MSSNIKLWIKKIIFGFSLFANYVSNGKYDMSKPSIILGKENIYDSKVLLSLIDRLFINTGKIIKSGYTNKIVNKNCNHIVFCLTGLLDPTKKSHSYVYYLWAKMYLEADPKNKVTFFITNEHIYLKYLLTGKKNIESEYFEDFKNLKYETNDERFNYVCLKTSTFDIACNIKKASEQIMDLNPTHLVYFSGAKCDSPFIRKVLFNFVPIIYHITISKHLLPSYAHLMIVPKGRPHWYSKNLPVLDIDNYFYGQKEDIPIDIDKNEQIIESFNNSSKPVVIATILGGKRILNTISSYSVHELNILLDFIDKNNIVWYFIGVEDETGFIKLSERINALITSKKIIIIKFKSAIEEFLKKVDIYSSLPKLIGGCGVAISALNNKAVLICDGNSDVSWILENRFIYDDFETYFQNLQILTNDAEKRVDTMIAQNLYLNKFSEKDKYERTSQKLKKATDIYLKNS